ISTAPSARSGRNARRWLTSAKAGGPCSSRCSTSRSLAESRDLSVRTAAASRMEGEASSASSSTNRVGRSLPSPALTLSRAASAAPPPRPGPDLLQGCVRRAGARDVEDHSPGALNLSGKLGGEASLADAAGAAHERNPGAPRFGLCPALAQPAELSLAPGEERGTALELARPLLLEGAG